MVRIWMYLEGRTNVIGKLLDVGEKNGIKNDCKVLTHATRRTEQHKEMRSLWEEQGLREKIRDSTLARVNCCFSFLLSCNKTL